MSYVIYIIRTKLSFGASVVLEKQPPGLLSPPPATDRNMASAPASAQPGQDQMAKQRREADRERFNQIILHEVR